MDLEEKKKKITRYSRIGKDAAHAKGGVADRTGKHVRMEVTACCPIQRQTPPPFKETNLPIIQKKKHTVYPGCARASQSAKWHFRFLGRCESDLIDIILASCPRPNDQTRP